MTSSTITVPKQAAAKRKGIRWVEALVLLLVTTTVLGRAHRADADHGFGIGPNPIDFHTVPYISNYTHSTHATLYNPSKRTIILINASYPPWLRIDPKIDVNNPRNLEANPANDPRKDQSILLAFTPPSAGQYIGTITFTYREQGNSSVWTKDVTVKAIAKAPALTVAILDSNGNPAQQGGIVTATGISCPSDCQESYAYNTQVRVSAAAAAGWAFDGFGGVCSINSACVVSPGNRAEATITMRGDYTLTARFVPAMCTPTGGLAVARSDHSATLLSDGRVLVAGGDTRNVEIYTPATGGWQSTANSAVERWGHTATLLPNGLVLIAGGQNRNGPTTLAELFDPQSGRWTPTGRTLQGRAWHTAHLLPDGKVMLVGGEDGAPNRALSTTEIYDPALGVWSLGPRLLSARTHHAAAQLSDGRILVVGGKSDVGVLTSSEIYSPNTGTWVSTGSLNTPRQVHTATLMSNGKVLVVGGANEGGILATAEQYQPQNGTWTTTAPLPGRARDYHTATAMSDGTVLITGGYAGTVFADAYRYDALAESWKPAATLNTPRGFHTATLLNDGRVLIVGGWRNEVGGLSSAELCR